MFKYFVKIKYCFKLKNAHLRRFSVYCSDNIIKQ